MILEIQANPYVEKGTAQLLPSRACFCFRTKALSDHIRPGTSPLPSAKPFGNQQRHQVSPTTDSRSAIWPTGRAVHFVVGRTRDATDDLLSFLYLTEATMRTT
jgi:hypothetical protein